MNPFITYGYESPEYFCDRVEETSELIRLLTNGNNVALISPRRMGKTGLLQHCFLQEEIKLNYETFLIDIYATKCLADMVWRLGYSIVNRLKPKGQSTIDKFLSVVSSLRTGISFDGMGNASWNIEVGDIKLPEFTLDEIFRYLSTCESHCIVAIDEFQTIMDYPEKNVEALLRTYVQNCRNAVFVFSGSQRTMMNEMFASPSRPFYQSVTIKPIYSIPLEKYQEFALYHFQKGNKCLESGVVPDIYNRFEGTTWYVQKILNELYSLTEQGDECNCSDIDVAIDNIVHSYEDTYKDLLYQLPARQVSLLLAIGKERKAMQITGSAFIKKYHLQSASSVQKSAAALLERQIITNSRGVYEVYDKFFATWITGYMQ